MEDYGSVAVVPLSEHAEAGCLSYGRLLGDIWAVIWSSPFWFSAHLISLILFGALEPSLAWVAKDAAGEIQRVQGVLNQIVISRAPIYLLIALGLALLRLCEHVARKVYEATVVFALQQVMLRRRPVACVSEDVTRMVYDCLEAKKSLSPLYSNLWRDLFRLISVACWQLSLAPAWLPAMGLSLLPSILGLVLLAPVIQNAKRGVLEENCRLTAQTPDGVSQGLVRRQQNLLRRLVNLECWTGGMEALLGLSAWPVLLALIMACHAWNWPLIPRHIAAGDMAALLVSLSLIYKPMAELGKSYVTLRGNWPALMRALYPHLPVGASKA